MAHADTSSFTRDRVVLTAALSLAAAVAGAAFGRVFVGASSTAILAGAGASSVLVCALLARRGIMLTVAVSAAALLTVVGWVAFPQTTLLGVPTPDTLGSISRAMAKLSAHAVSETAPAAPLPSLMTASLVAVWCAGFATHALATRAGNPGLALLPPAAVLGFASMLSKQGPRPGYAALYVVASLGVLLGSGFQRLRTWTSSGDRSPRLLSGPQASLARQLAGIALIFTVLLPGIVPGLRADSIADLRGRVQGERVGLSPIVDIRPSLIRDPGVELFHVRSDRPAYWRLLSLERFDGRVWTSGSLSTVRGPRLTGRDTLTHWGIRGPALEDERVLEQEIELVNLRPTWLPMAYEPLSFDLGDTAARFDPSRVALVPEGEVPEGYRYRVESVLTVPAVDELQAISHGPASPSSVDTALPPSLPAEIDRIAREIVAGETTLYGQVMAIQRHLRTFTYDLEAPAGHDTDDLLFFLTRSRRGYCEQFAAAMAVLARSLGIGARVALGFTAGSPGADGRYLVTSKNAHAWTEIWFPGYGWLAFEPTPARNNPVAASYAAPATVVGGGSRLGEVALTQQQADGARQRDAVEQRPQGQRDGATPNRAPLMPLLAVIGLAALAAVFAPRILVRFRHRRRALGPSSEPRTRVIAAYGLFQDGARRSGWGRRPAETPAEHRVRLARDAAAWPELDRLTILTTDALYSPRTILPAEAERAAADAAALRRAVRAIPRRSPVGSRPGAPG